MIKNLKNIHFCHGENVTALTFWYHKWGSHITINPIIYSCHFSRVLSTKQTSEASTIVCVQDTASNLPLGCRIWSDHIIDCTDYMLVTLWLHHLFQKIWGQHFYGIIVDHCRSLNSSCTEDTDHGWRCKHVDFPIIITCYMYIKW